MKNIKLDEIDKKIVRILQKDVRTPCDILPVMNDGASYEERLVVVGSESNEVC